MGLFDKMKGVASQAVGEAQTEIAKAKDDFAAARADDPVLAHDAAAAASVPTAAAPVPLMEIVSHIDGKNAKVRLWPDRLEWERPRGLSGGKLTAGVLTGGASLLVTGVKGGKDEHDMVFLRNVTNVNSRKDGIMYYAVEVQTASGGAVNTVSFRVSKTEANEFRSSILAAMQRLQGEQSAPATVHVVAPAAATEAAAVPDLAAQLHQLAALRDAGILSEQEFAMKKADILGRM